MRHQDIGLLDIAHDERTRTQGREARGDEGAASLAASCVRVRFFRPLSIHPPRPPTPRSKPTLPKIIATETWHGPWRASHAVLAWQWGSMARSVLMGVPSSLVHSSRDGAAWSVGPPPARLCPGCSLTRAMPTVAPDRRQQPGQEDGRGSSWLATPLSTPDP